MTSRELAGTAFPIGGDLFLTARHVVEYVGKNGGLLVLGRPNPSRGDFLAFDASVRADWPGVDLSAVHAPSVNLAPLTWDTQILPLFTRVRSAGFPLAFNTETTPPRVIFRGLEGIVSGVRTHRPLPAAPWVYETSFQCPRGLSGAPLLREDTQSVAGCVIGNSQSFMEVSWTEEEIRDPHGEVVGIERERRVEGIYFGVAVCAKVIMDLLLSPTLTVREHIVRHGGNVIDETEVR
jgi:hypothetical protein